MQFHPQKEFFGVQNKKKKCKAFHQSQAMMCKMAGCSRRVTGEKCAQPGDKGAQWWWGGPSKCGLIPTVGSK